MRALVLALIVLAIPAWADTPWYPGGTNYIQGSEIFTPTLDPSDVLHWHTWNNCTVVENAALAPDGRMVAARVTVLTPSNNSGVYYRFIDGTLTPGVTHTFSIYVRSESGAPLSFRVARNNEVYWNGTDVSPTFIATAEWQRFSLTFTPGVEDVRANIHVLAEGFTPFAASVGDYLFHGAQVTNRSKPLPYHPTAPGTITSWSPRYRKGGLIWLPF